MNDTRAERMDLLVAALFCFIIVAAFVVLAVCQ